MIYEWDENNTKAMIGWWHDWNENKIRANTLWWLLGWWNDCDENENNIRAMIISWLDDGMIGMRTAKEPWL